MYLEYEPVSYERTVLLVGKVSGARPARDAVRARPNLVCCRA